MSSQPSTGFFAKIRSNYTAKLGNLSIGSTISSEKDGSSEDDTLIHKALVKHFDTTAGRAYPEWLGVPRDTASSSSQSYTQDYSRSQLQPVARPSHQSPSPSLPQSQSQPTPSTSSQQNSSEIPQRPSYQPRTSSRLQEMYNKTRQVAPPPPGSRTRPGATWGRS